MPTDRHGHPASIFGADLVLLVAYLSEHVPGGPHTVQRLPSGHSNLTYVVTGSDGCEWILRRPPEGVLQPGAHDMRREYGVLQALRGSPARVPTAVAFCDDTSVVGAPFYVMERVPGEVIRADMPRWLEGAGRSKRGELMTDLARALAEIHRADTETLFAAKLGRPTGYIERQIAGWDRQWQTMRATPTGRDLPDYDQVLSWLVERRPACMAPTVVHGDYKLDNVVIDPETATVRVVVDWEMTTVGDPLADVGFLLFNSPQAGVEPVLPELTGTVTAAPGFLSHAEILHSYRESGGAATATSENVAYYEVLAGWKMAVLLEASYQRHLAGTTDDPFFFVLNDGVPRLLSAAVGLAKHASIGSSISNG